MSLIKLANEVDSLQHKPHQQDRANRFADYIIPATKGGALLGAGASGTYNFLKGPKKLSNLKNVTNAAGTGALVGGGVGFSTSPITSKVGEGGKVLAAKALPQEFSDNASAEMLHGISAGTAGATTGGLVGKRLQTLGRIKGKGTLKGGLLGGSAGSAFGSSFENDIQKGKQRRADKRQRREEYKKLKDLQNNI